MEEVWKDVNGYEGFYQVSNYGRIKSVDRTVASRGNYINNIKGKILKTFTIYSGYVYACLSKNGSSISKRVHRLMAEAFLEKKEGCDIVNHKDENPTNNFIFVRDDGSVDEEKSNLEWCNQKYNINYGTRNKRVSEKQRILYGKRVIQYSLDGVEIARYRSVKDAEESTGVISANIRACAGHKLYRNKSGNYTPRFKAGGFKWEYE